DLLRFRNEGLVGGAGEIGLGFECLVQRLHAGKLLDEGLRVFERLLGVVAVGAGDRLEAVLHRGRGSDALLELLFSVVLKVFNLEHHESFFPGLDWSGSSAPWTLPAYSALHKNRQESCATHKNETNHGESWRSPQGFLKLLETGRP